jgi:Lipase.
VKLVHKIKPHREHPCFICASIDALSVFCNVTGLDPAQPCFQDDSPDIRLDPSDADFIDVIHTNGRILMKVGLGLPEPIGKMFSLPHRHIMRITIINDCLHFILCENQLETSRCKSNVNHMRN